jgi:hypothetical protein
MPVAVFFAVRCGSACSFCSCGSVAPPLGRDGDCLWRRARPFACVAPGALVHLVGQASPAAIVLPIGLPWVGANFRLDALSAFFLVVINLGAAAASFYGIGYGRHEREPQRVLPFYSAFLAGMNLVLLADDAFAFPGVMGVHVARLLGAGDGASSGAGQYTGWLRLYCYGESWDNGPATRVCFVGRAARRLHLHGDAREHRAAGPGQSRARTGVLVAFGALLLRLHGMAFGKPSGDVGPIKASSLPIGAHFGLALMAGIWLPPPLVAWFQHVASLLR